MREHPLISFSRCSLIDYFTPRGVLLIIMLTHCGADFITMANSMIEAVKVSINEFYRSLFFDIRRVRMIGDVSALI